MSPSKFHDQPAKKDINFVNGGHLLPLKISKDSHSIQKSSSSSSSPISSSSSLTGIAAVGGKNQSPSSSQQRQPVIIYTHSPKVIHTKARDFMALVQKLTGLSHSDDEALQPQRSECVSSSKGKGNNMKVTANGDIKPSSVITNENFGGVRDVQMNSSSSNSPTYDPPNPYLSNVPLLPSNSSNFFCSPQPCYRYTDHLLSSANIGDTLSPSMLQVLKGYPD
ncbi:hypothetical protein FRX31_015776 [Thalictrum thalictroides]|uniref:VQ domain-containing protein n=1 Tax=Thalictrum thalictroides TaxID=46969 RepID=A0A7J6WCP3_THATH|nr:hypothetical protein FRX31_015776 [Thalictrum thalictroides]